VSGKSLAAQTNPVWKKDQNPALSLPLFLALIVMEGAPSCVWKSAQGLPTLKAITRF
jgi:hypothetical protein